MYELQSGISQFCNKYFLPHKVQFNVQLLTEEVLQVIPLDKGEIDYTLRYSEKDGLISLEFLMPAGIDSVLKNPSFAPDELGMSIIHGLSGKIEEVIEKLPHSNRLRLRYEIKRADIVSK